MSIMQSLFGLLFLFLASLHLLVGVSLRAGEFTTYCVSSLLFLVTLLVGCSLGLIGSALLLVQGLPLLTEDLADLACARLDLQS